MSTPHAMALVVSVSSFNFLTTNTAATISNDLNFFYHSVVLILSIMWLLTGLVKVGELGLKRK